MLGAVIGDIVGSIYEFNNIKRKDFILFDPFCFFTDDSIMTFAIAEAYYGIQENIHDQALSFLDKRLLKLYNKHYKSSTILC